MADSVNIHYAKTHLSALLKRVREGAVITISNAGEPIAKLVPLAHTSARTPGGFAFKLTRKFFEPIPADELEAWGAMNLLLDTHALIWWLDDDRRLSKRARKVIADTATTVFVSSATGYEMAMKARIGKMADPDGAIPRLGAVLAERGMMELPISMSHAVEAGRIDGEHKDPFDRILIAQSRMEGLPIVTNDPVFADHGVRVIW